MKFRHTQVFGWLIPLALAGCATATPPAPKTEPAHPAAPPAAPPASVAPEANSTAPEAGYTARRPFPKVRTELLDNGLQVHIVERHDMPVVAAELLINSGIASEGDRAGAAKVTAEWLEAGGAGRWNSKKLREVIDALGASLDISVTRDSTRYELAVTSDRTDAAVEILSAVVQHPRFDTVEFKKLRQREIERVSSLARTSGAWMAQFWLQRTLFHQPIGVHPYATFDATADELNRLEPRACREWYRDYVTPRNAHLILVGDISASAAIDLAKKHLGTWSGPEVRGFGPSEPEGIKQFEIFVVDRPSSTQSDIFLALLGPTRQEAAYPLAAIEQQIVGGGVSGRLFLDVREKRSLAYSTGASIQDLAMGPSVLYLSAGTQTAKTAETVGALLEHLEKLETGHFTESEFDTAKRYIIESMPIRWEQVQSLGAQVAQLRSLRLSNDYFDTLRDQVGNSTLQDVASWSSNAFKRDRAVLVLAGDSKAVVPGLRKYARVSVVDPSHNFRIREQLAQTAGQ